MTRHIQKRSQRGFTMVEVMVAFAVLAFGLLAVASFQSKLVSGSGLNKARSEAISLAQQKLDEIRSYTDEPTLVANLEGRSTPIDGDQFPADVEDGDYPTTPETIPGVNAEYQRQWNVAVAGRVADVVVTVSWDDPRVGQQSVSINTAMTWKNPRGGAELTDVEDPLVPSATGRASLGEGEVSLDDIPDSADNGDGTATGDFDGDGDLELVDLNSPDEGMAPVVLTLKDACNIETGECTDFVKISGRLYIDEAESPMTLAEVYVLASDAAYCSRDLDNQGTSPTGDYSYYDYTCYLGGGWHGNIGILMDGGPHDIACMGDPNASLLDGTEKWKHYELAKRRVYRGMIHKVDESGNEITNDNGDTLFYSQGIADAVTLPDSNWPARYYGHDFVVTQIQGSGTGGGTAADCLDALTRADSDTNSDGEMGDIFTGVSSDFVCLNNDYIDNAYAEGVDPNAYNVYLDTFDADLYRARNDCPYDPSDPPSHRFVISGEIVTGTTTPGSMQIVTSDGEDNCRWTIGASSTSYECDVYAWEDADGNVQGWDGAITVRPPADLLCAAEPVDGDTVYTNPVVRTYSGIDYNDTNEDYACNTLASMQISGTIEAPSSDLTGGYVDAGDDTAECTFNVGTEIATYFCNVIEPSVGLGWSGTITFTPPASMPAGACSPTEWPFTNLDAASTGNDSLCSVPQEAFIVGTMSTSSGVDLSIMQVHANGSTCSIAELDGEMKYTCHVVHYGDGWSGDVTSDSGDPDIRCLPTTTAMTGVTGTLAEPTPGPTISCEVDLGGEVVVNGNIRVYDLSRTRPTTPDITDGSCTLNNGSPVPFNGTDVDVPYSCTTIRIDHGATWTGTLTFSDTGGKTFCGGDTRSYTDVEPRTVLEENIIIEKNANSCP
ncbi:MAG: prepilin-type N-terminal cleavage/methylation domain-containing protein [Gammaproteobacteria bacterium]|nr:prepilin-type N-terminal cleavage/methylation domain-containing protein [Gammaproteobacteria bacterium]